MCKIEKNKASYDETEENTAQFIQNRKKLS